MNTDEFYESYIHDEVLYNRMNWIHRVINKPSDNIIDILKSIAVFSMIEGAILYSSFAFLKHFQAEGKNKLVNVTAGINFSVRDENCLIKGTEVLTSSGWKPIELITLEDEVCQYDLVTGMLTYNKPLALFHTESKEYYEIDGEYIHQIVTPEHRMITRCGVKLAKDCNENESYIISGWRVGTEIYSTNNIENAKKMMRGELTPSWIYDKITKLSSFAAEDIINVCLKAPELITDEIKDVMDTLANIASGVIKDGMFEEKKYDPANIIKHVGELKQFYCLDVATTAFLIRSNGKISVSGNCHSEAGAWLFKTLAEESQISSIEMDDIHRAIIETAEHIEKHEERIIDMIFEKGSIKGITDHQLKAFIQHRLDVCLEQLGFKKHFNPSYNPIKNWFYKNINAPQMHDFFYKMGNQYRRDWNEQGFIWKI